MNWMAYKFAHDVALPGLNGARARFNTKSSFDCKSRDSTCSWMVANAAFEGGYESADQLNGEYRCLFGQSPMRDIKVLRTANIVATSVN